MYTRLSRLRVLAGASIFAALALALAMPSVMGQPSGSATVHLGSLLAIPSASASVSATSSPSTPQSTPTGQGNKVTLKPAATCANLKKHSGDAFIDFCTPSFDGNVEGPWGSRVTLVGGNFKAAPAAIYLAPTNSLAALTQSGCVFPTTNCLEFDNATNGSDVKSLLGQKFSSEFTLTFTWSFPTTSTTVGADYSLVAEVAGGRAVTSSANFTLLSNVQPCIAVAASGNAPDCSTTPNLAQPLSVLEGQSLQIAGSGWLPGDKKQTIAIALHCDTCAQKVVSLGQLSTTGTDQSMTGGQATASKPLTLPTGVTGDYRVIATNHDQSEVYGDSDAQAITLHIVAHPCIEIGVGCVWDGSNMPTPVAQAKSATIMLQNWKSGDKVSVFIVPSVKSAQDCNASKPLGAAQSLTPSSSAVGQSFALPSSLKVNQNYTICAVGHSALGGDTVSAAIQVKITKPVAHPLFSMMSLLALLFGLVGVGAYIMATRERAVTVPQPVVRR